MALEILNRVNFNLGKGDSLTNKMTNGAKFIERYTVRKIFKWAPLITVIAYVIFIRVRLLSFPLERDEGEYAYFGQLILRGIFPYVAAYNMKLPGTYFMYAIIMAIFGQTIWGIHLGLLVLNILSIVLIFLLSKKIANDIVAIVSSMTYAVLSLSYSVLGFAAHASHFVVLYALLGFLLLLKAIEYNKWRSYMYSGVLFSLAFIMKQPGIFFCIFGASAIIFYGVTSKPVMYKRIFFNFLMFSLGFLFPILITLCAIYRAGAFDTFWFWTITYLSKYSSQIPLSSVISIFRTRLLEVVDKFSLLWILSVYGLVATIFQARSDKKKSIILFFAFFSYLSICPGFYFREHYFVTLLPAIAILTGMFFDYANTRFLKNKYLAIGLFLVIALVGIIQQREYLFIKKPSELCRQIYGENPFPESIEVASFIQSRTGKNDTVAVLGSEPEICFYSKRKSATGYIYTYSLMEKHEYSLTMQKEMVREIESSDPVFVILVNVQTSWLRRPDSETYIFDWAKRYISEKFVLVGVVDIFSDKTVYKWGNEAKTYKQVSPAHLLVFEKERRDIG